MTLVGMYARRITNCNSCLDRRKSEQEWIEGPAQEEIAFHTEALNIFRTWASKGHEDK